MKLGYLSDNQARLAHISNLGVDLQPQFWRCLFLRLYRLIRLGGGFVGLWSIAGASGKGMLTGPLGNGAFGTYLDC